MTGVGIFIAGMCAALWVSFKNMLKSGDDQIRPAFSSEPKPLSRREGLAFATLAAAVRKFAAA
jgi:hypothetical protein